MENTRKLHENIVHLVTVQTGLLSAQTGLLSAQTGLLRDLEVLSRGPINQSCCSIHYRYALIPGNPVDFYST